MDKKILLISAIFLSISILISSFFTYKGLDNVAKSISDQKFSSSGNIVAEINENNIMTLDLAAQYIGITSDKLQKIVDDESSGIPFLKVDGNVIFSKNGIDQWLGEKRRVIN